MSTGKKLVARIVGDFIPQGPNRKQRRRSFFFAKRAKQLAPGTTWKNDGYKSKNTPVHWELQEVK